MASYKLNKEIEVFIQAKDARGGSYSLKDIEYISQYSGMGGKIKEGASGAGVLHEFYTPDWVCQLMYELAVYHGYDGGNVLDPAIATGNIIEPYSDKSRVTGFELNPVSARIAELRFPGVNIHRDYFETAFLQPISEGIYGQKMRSTTWLNEFPFSLVTGNPPYGENRNYYSGRLKKGSEKFSLMEVAFMHYGLKLLKPGGLLVYITGSNFMRNGIKYEKQKQELGKLADLLDAYRLPPVFADTNITTDILVFKRK